MKTPAALHSFAESAKARALNAIEVFADTDFRRFFRRRWIFLRSYVRRDSWSKLVCLVLAAFAFYYIRSNVLDSAQFNVVIKPVTPAGSDYSILETSPASVTVKVRGSFQHSAFKTQEGLQLQLPVKYKGERTSKIRLNRRMFQDLVERDISIVSIEPDSVKITFDEDVTRTFRVNKPGTVNEPVLKHYSLDIPWDDKSVDVSGPRSVLEKYPEDHAFDTKPIELSGRVGSFSDEVAIEKGPNTVNLKFSKEKIPVKVILEDRRVERRVDGVKLLLAAASGDGNRYVSDPSEISVNLKGLEETIQDIAVTNIFAIVECYPDKVPGECPVFVGLRPREKFPSVEMSLEEVHKKVRISIEQPPEPMEPEPEKSPDVQEAQETPVNQDDQESSEKPEAQEKPEVQDPPMALGSQGTPDSPEPPALPETPPPPAPAATADEPPPPEARQ